MTFNVYSRANKIRLYLNDSLIGEAPVSETYKAIFNIPYKPGVLKAVQLVGEKEGSSASLSTTGKPIAIRLVPDRQIIKADEQDLSFVTIELIDEKGRLVLDNNRKVKIECNGDGEIIASGNASPNDMESFRSLTPKLFNGRAMVIVKSGNSSGLIKLAVSSDGFKTSVITIKTQK